MACRTGCPTQDHANWGECARSSLIQLGDLGHGVTAYTDRRLKSYAEARGLGLQPPSTKLTDSTATMRAVGA